MMFLKTICSSFVNTFVFFFFFFFFAAENAFVVLTVA